MLRKIALPLILLMALAELATAQQAELRAGYFSTIPNPFGAKLSIDKPLYKGTRGLASTGRSHNWRVQSGVAVSVRPRFQSNLLASVALGWKTDKPKSNRYFGFYFSTAYMARQEVLNIVVDLNGKGDIRERELRGYALEGIEIEFGQRLFDKVWLYQRPALAIRLSSVHESAAMLMLEVGVQLKLTSQ